MKVSPPAPRSFSPSRLPSLLEAAFFAARQEWSRLYAEGDCLTDPKKRGAMLLARLRYQEAKLNWLFRG